jgi:hypothetical protein
MDKTAPVKIVHMPLWTGAHKAGRHNWPAVESPFIVELFAMDKSA